MRTTVNLKLTGLTLTTTLTLEKAIKTLRLHEAIETLKEGDGYFIDNNNDLSDLRYQINDLLATDYTDFTEKDAITIFKEIAKNYGYKTRDISKNIKENAL